MFSAFPGVEATSAGTNLDADTPVSSELIEWADIIFAMENAHRKRLNDRFQSLLKNKQVVVLGIPDRYTYMNAELIELLKAKVLRYIVKV